MLGKIGHIRILAVVVVLGAVLNPQVAKAGDRDRNHHRHHDYSHSWRHHDHYRHPRGLEFTFSNGSVALSYHNPRPHYVYVRPRIGAIVNTVPSYYSTYIINGRTYFLSNGVYYHREPRGYIVVEDPSIIRPATVLVSESPSFVISDRYGEDAFTVNVPNHNGGYTTVIMKKTSNGYLGPQGEFYNQFPSVAQLKVMYGK